MQPLSHHPGLPSLTSAEKRSPHGLSHNYLGYFVKCCQYLPAKGLGVEKLCLLLVPEREDSQCGGPGGISVRAYEKGLTGFGFRANRKLILQKWVLNESSIREKP